MFQPHFECFAKVYWRSQSFSLKDVINRLVKQMEGLFKLRGFLQV